MPTLHIKTGDVVKVITGKYKGKTGKVLQSFPKLSRIVVEGVSLSKRHIRTRREGEKGQVIEFSMPIHASNVVLADAAAAAPKAAAKKPKAAKKSADESKA